MRQSQKELPCRVVDATRAIPRVLQTMIQTPDCLSTHGARTEENAKNSELKKKKLLSVPLEADRLKAAQPALETIKLGCLPTQEAQAAVMGPQPLCRGAGPISSNKKEDHGPKLAVDCQPTPVGPAVMLAARCVH